MNIKESLELHKPSSKVSRKYRFKNRQTINQIKSTQYEFNTKLGNKISLHFDFKEPRYYEVMFYVNNTLYDDSSIKDKDVARDSEILGTVFNLILKKADLLKANKLKFYATDSPSDIKIIRNIDVEYFKKILLKDLRNLLNLINYYRPKLIFPSEVKISLFKKLNRGMPEPEYDINKKYLVNFVLNILSKIISINLKNEIEIYKLDSDLESLINKIYLGTFSVLEFNDNDLIEKIKKYKSSILSMTSRGYQRIENRRANIYNKILEKYFTEKWKIIKNGNTFYLERKNEI